MLNHYRTLLLNVEGDESGVKNHVPAGYTPQALKADMTRLYSALFPSNDNTAKYHYVHNYLSLLNSTNSDLKKYDSRISYNLADTTNFQLTKTSSVKASNPECPIIVSGDFQPQKVQNYYSDTFFISNTPAAAQAFTVYSKVTGLYHTPEGKSQTPETLMPSWVQWVDRSEHIHISDTGLYFSFLKTPTYLTTPNKTWEFSVSAPREFDFFGIFNTIKALKPFKIFARYGVDVSDEEVTWNEHFNPVYKFAAFLRAYVKVMNSLL